METNNADRAVPLLIYDGDCTFCLYWARYWQKLTGDAVSYKPYQDVSAQYPSITKAEFQRAVQYVATDGKIASGAKASFLTLSHARGKAFWLFLYCWFPGFAFISEKAYRMIASHRSFFYKVSLLLWGHNYEPPQYNIVSWVFLRALGLIYFAAFISFATQALGLIGSQGIVPLADFTNAVSNQFGVERYWLLPMLFWFNSSDLAIQLVSWGGAVLSLLLLFNIFPRISLVLLSIFYLSLIYAGQVFMTFQWDLFLLETGVLALFLFRFQVLGIWLLRWLLFRFIFVSGIVKWASGDIAWRDFSALSYHFLTQPLPTPVAWYAYYLPQSILQFGTAAALFIELFVPFLIFFPRRLRFLSAFAILILQGSILITGNYNFFNILTIALCLVLFDDAALRKIIPIRLTSYIMRRVKNIRPHMVTTFFAVSFAVFTVFISFVQFNARFIGSVPMAFIRVDAVVSPLRLVSTYGPFAVMTKERMEIVIEGSNDGINWSEYTFKYKPGDVNRPPLWNIPHQPRLDWQLWFASLGTTENNPWFMRFVQRLLENSPPVIALLEYNPFPDSPPKYVRAQYYEYRYTTNQERRKTGAWWDRRSVMLYLPEVHLR